MTKGFLEYVAGTSFVHRMNPVIKLACALLLSLACFCTSNIFFLLAMLVLGLGAAAHCGVIAQVTQVVRAVAIFSILLALIALLTTSSGTELIALPWGYLGTGSILAAAVIVVRLMACAVPLCLVMYATKLTDLTNALVKMLHVPYRYAFTFTSAVHFIPGFMNDMAAVMEAQTARGVGFDGDFAHKLRLMVPLTVPLLVSSVRKIEASAIAAETRGFSLRTAVSGYKEYPLAALDALVMLASVAVFACAIVLTVLL